MAAMLADASDNLHSGTRCVPRVNEMRGTLDVAAKTRVLLRDHVHRLLPTLVQARRPVPMGTSCPPRLASALVGICDKGKLVPVSLSQNGYGPLAT
mmetsp:Transcript_975/g.760  ORF Transcript_975/g.760 Transcript_975/m.760 type:complete len:96 (+) Transcript_975:77-364(+)